MKPYPRYLFDFVFGAAWLFACAVTISALDPQKAVTQYVHDVWTTSDGLPQDSINSIAQDGDGYIWFGTQEGLVRFDAVNFTVFDKRKTDALKANGVHTLFVDRDGTLWVGASDGMLRHSRGGSIFSRKNTDCHRTTASKTFHRMRRAISRSATAWATREAAAWVCTALITDGQRLSQLKPAYHDALSVRSIIRSE
jgi:ligand-binding sensor domain-containing protein